MFCVFLFEEVAFSGFPHGCIFLLRFDDNWWEGKGNNKLKISGNVFVCVCFFAEGTPFWD